MFYYNIFLTLNESVQSSIWISGLGYPLHQQILTHNQLYIYYLLILSINFIWEYVGMVSSSILISSSF